MTRNDLEHKLVDIPPGARDVEPPEDLLAQLKADIPRELPIADRADRAEEPPASSAWTHRFKIAAAVVLLVGGGYLTARLVPELEPPTAEPARETAPRASEPETDLERSETTAPSDALRDDADVEQETAEVHQEAAADALAPLGYAEPRNEARKRAQESAPVAKPQTPAPEPAPEAEEAPRWVGTSAPLQMRRGLAKGVPPEAEPLAPPPPPAQPVRWAPVAEEIVVKDEALDAQTGPETVPEEPKEPEQTFWDEIEVEAEAPVVDVTSSIAAEVVEDSVRVWLQSLPNLSEGDFVDVRADPFSTFGLEVDTGSFTLARRYVSMGEMPPAESVRVEEWLNAFDYDDPAPSAGTFEMVAQGAPSPFGGLEAPKRHVLRLGVQATEAVPTRSGPASLTFVVDVSGSMEGPERLGLVKESLGLLLSELRPEDSVALVIYGNHGEVVLPHTRDKEAIRTALDGLVAGGSTNAEEGLVLGYREAEKAFRPKGVNRVILCSDGVANVGATGPDSILESIGEQADRGIELTTLGFGMGEYNDHLMERLADQGDGRYAYVDGLEEAHRLLVEELAGTLMTVAEETRVQVEWNPAAVRGYRLIGYENRAIPDEEFRYDSTDAGEIGPGHAVTALYEVELTEPIVPGRPLGVWRIRYRDPATDRFIEESRYLTPADLSPSWGQAPPALRFAALVAAAARAVEAGEVDRLERIAESLRQVVETAYPEDGRKAEVVEMLARGAHLKPPSPDPSKTPPRRGDSPSPPG